MPKQWFTITAAAKPAAPLEASIFEEINPFYGVTAKQFLADIKAKRGDSRELNLAINSPGGEVFEGLAIYNGLKMSGLTINVTIMGIAASIASVIAMAGDTISMPANSMMMVHNSRGGARGTAEDHREFADILDKIDNSIVGIYIARTGKLEADVRAMLAQDTFLSAQEALDFGLATAITDKVAVTALFEVDQFDAKVKALFEPAKPAAESGVSLAVITGLATQAGVGEYAAAWAIDATLTDVTLVVGAIERAVETKALCAALGDPESAAAHITANASLATVRGALALARADASDALAVDTARKGKEKNPATDFNPTDLWAKVHAMNAAMSGRSKK